jgi:hypothetical protein
MLHHLVHIWRLKCTAQGVMMNHRRTIQAHYLTEDDAMKAGWMIIIACILVLVWCKPVAAMEQVYLPIVAHDQTSAVYRVDHIRLWDLYESDGAQSSPIDCGHGGRVQVHVFDRRGDVGAAARINGVTVQVVQYIDGHRNVQYYVTHSDAAGSGIAEFTVQEWAHINLVIDADGQPIASPIASVSPNLRDASPEQLMSALYCTDLATCTALVAANACHGHMSWSVVFVRTF